MPRDEARGCCRTLWTSSASRVTAREHHYRDDRLSRSRPRTQALPRSWLTSPKRTIGSGDALMSAFDEAGLHAFAGARDQLQPGHMLPRYDQRHASTPSRAVNLVPALPRIGLRPVGLWPVDIKTADSSPRYD